MQINHSIRFYNYFAMTISKCSFLQNISIYVTGQAKRGHMRVMRVKRRAFRTISVSLVVYCFLQYQTKNKKTRVGPCGWPALRYGGSLLSVVVGLYSGNYSGALGVAVAALQQRGTPRATPTPHAPNPPHVYVRPRKRREQEDDQRASKRAWLGLGLGFGIGFGLG